MIGLLAVTPPVFYYGQQVWFVNNDALLTGMVLADQAGSAVWYTSRHEARVTVRTADLEIFGVPVSELR